MINISVEEDTRKQLRAYLDLSRYSIGVTDRLYDEGETVCIGPQEVALQKFTATSEFYYLGRPSFTHVIRISTGLSMYLERGVYQRVKDMKDFIIKSYPSASTNLIKTPQGVWYDLLLHQYADEFQWQISTLLAICEVK
jgi:hypothetical protein